MQVVPYSSFLNLLSASLSVVMGLFSDSSPTDERDFIHSLKQTLEEKKKTQPSSPLKVFDPVDPVSLPTIQQTLRRVPSAPAKYGGF